MKKRILSALLVFCLACSLVGTAWAADGLPTAAPTATPDVSNVVTTDKSEDTTEGETSNPATQSEGEGETDPTEAPADPTATPTASPEPSESPAPAATPDAEQPEVTPTPVPEETATPAPEPTAEATEAPAEPEPTAAPTATPNGVVLEDGSVEYTAVLAEDEAAPALNVVVTAPAGAFDEGVNPTLSVSAIEDENDLNDIEDELEGEVEYDGFAALDIRFVDADGNEIEPSEPVKVRIELPDSIVDSGIDLSTLAVSHLVEDEQGEVTAVEQVASVDDGGITFSNELVAEANQAIGVSPMMASAANNTLSNSDETSVVAEFEVTAFSYFVLHYNLDLFHVNDLSILCVDEEGNVIGDSGSLGTIDISITDDHEFTVDEIREQLNTNINGYTFKEARVVTQGTNDEGEEYYDTVVADAIRINSNIFEPDKWGWAYRDDEYGEWHNMTIWNDLFGDESHTVYFVYTKDEPTEEPEAPTVTVPEHSKTATISTDPRDAKGTYDLTLDVKGEINSSTSTMPLNLLLIIDKSGSMKETMSNGNGGMTTKKQAVVDAVSKLTSTLENNQAVDVRYDVVMFSGANDSGTGTVVSWTDSADAVNNAVSRFNPNGGTNYQHGIQQAIRDLTVETEGMIKNAATCVIFLTDGEPTYRLWNGWQLGDGSYDDGGRNIAAAVSEISRMSVDSFYCIGTGNDFSNENSQAVKNLQSLCNAVAATDTDWFRATNVNELNDAFDKIAGATTTLACNNITVTDTLSKWVDAVEGKNPHIKVTRPGDDGSEVVIAEGDNSVNIPGNTVQNKEASYTITASYDPATKQFQLTFPSNYVLENGWTYSVTLKIQPNADAVADYEAKNKIYPNTGDDGTGSHANDVGYYSNASNAILSYKSVNDKPEDEAAEAEYPMPVIQIDDSLLTPKTATLTLQKTFVGLTDEDVYYLLFGQTKSTNEKDRREANFSFDVNFCDTKEASSDESGGWMENLQNQQDNDSPYKDETYYRPGTTEKITNGGEFIVYSVDCLEDEGLEKFKTDGYFQDNRDQNDIGAYLRKEGDNWVYTQTLTVPTCAADGTRYFYTVFEQHAELPGYSKLDTSSTKYTVSLNNGAQTWNGTGKFVCDAGESIVSMDGITEQECIAGKTQDDKTITQFARLCITGDTTITFENNYLDAVKVTKNVTLDGKLITAGNPELNKEYIVTLSPADTSKLVSTSSDSNKKGQGPNWNSKMAGYTVTAAYSGGLKNHSKTTLTFNDDGTLDIPLYAGETVTLGKLPSISYMLSEDANVTADTDSYYFSEKSFAETYDDKVSSDAAQWNSYNDGDDVGKMNLSDGKLAVDVSLTDDQGESVAVTLTNQYKSYKTLTIQKTVTGSMSTDNDWFDFDLTGVNDDQYKLDDEQKTTTPGYDFRLNNNSTVTLIKLKAGDEITITENADKGYTLKEVKVDSSVLKKQEGGEGDYTTKPAGIAITIPETEQTDLGTIVFTNERETVAPTGLESNHTAPYTLIITAAGLAGLALIGSVAARRVRRRREE